MLRACSTNLHSDSSIERTSSMAQGILGILDQIGRGFERIYEEDIPTMQEVRGLLGMGAPQPPSRTEFVRNILSSRYSPEVVAGMMGNIDVETGGTFDPMQKQTKGPGRGLFQMEGKMLRAYNKYIDDNDLKNTAQSQLDFMSEILSNSNVYDIGAGHRKAMKKAFESGNVDTITSEFSKRVLRPGKPHLDRRLESARRFSR